MSGLGPLLSRQRYSGLSVIDTNIDQTNNVKLIIGMRSDLNKKYHQELNEVDNQNRSLFHFEINLDSGRDVGKDKEYSRYFGNKG